MNIYVNFEYYASKYYKKGGIKMNFNQGFNPYWGNGRGRGRGRGRGYGWGNRRRGGFGLILPLPGPFPFGFFI